MNSDINLLQTTRKHSSPVLEKRVKVFRVISISFLFLVGVVSAGLFLISIFSPLTGLKEEEQGLIAQFSSESLRKKTDSYFLTKVRSEDITKLLKNRSANMKTYSFLSGLSSDAVVLSELKIDDLGAAMSVNSPDLTALEGIISELGKLPDTDKTIESMTISEITFDNSSGNYEVVIEIKLKTV